MLQYLTKDSEPWQEQMLNLQGLQNKLREHTKLANELLQQPLVTPHSSTSVSNATASAKSTYPSGSDRAATSSTPDSSSSVVSSLRGGTGEKSSDASFAALEDSAHWHCDVKGCEETIWGPCNECPIDFNNGNSDGKSYFCHLHQDHASGHKTGGRKRVRATK